ncbi:hypothetical phage protein [Campylobacter phage CPt10]|uniref:Uncharacterized protein n=2 Tax=Firehammervirus CPt10 TaxID=722418 RepID=A0A410T7E2_9CAUD|nr:hypothetical protein APL46_gp016 [Campylobacter phage CPt10]QAU04753.1 hypothetical protein [Campylobacter phage CP20]CBJ94218.1 hypothetical phage protein [Campylobacter phage CPt10]
MSMYITYIDQGAYNMIVSAQRDNAFLLPGSSTLEVFDSKLFTAVLEALADKKTCKFYKDVDVLTLENLEIDESANLVKNSYIFQLTSAMGQIFTKIPQYTYFRFQYLNNIFASMGYFITEKNREEIYIKILETDDDALIANLEEYLKIVNQLNQYEKMYQEFLNGLDEMEMTDDEATLDQILQEALNYFTNAQKNFVTMDYKGWFSTIKADYENRQNSAQPSNQASNQTANS